MERQLGTHIIEDYGAAAVSRSSKDRTRSIEVQPRHTDASRILEAALHEGRHTLPVMVVDTSQCPGCPLRRRPSLIVDAAVNGLSWHHNPGVGRS